MKPNPELYTAGKPERQTYKENLWKEKLNKGEEATSAKNKNSNIIIDIMDC